MISKNRYAIPLAKKLTKPSDKNNSNSFSGEQEKLFLNWGILSLKRYSQLNFAGNGIPFDQIFSPLAIQLTYHSYCKQLNRSVHKTPNPNATLIKIPN